MDFNTLMLIIVVGLVGIAFLATILMRTNPKKRQKRRCDNCGNYHCEWHDANWRASSEHPYRDFLEREKKVCIHHFYYGEMDNG